MSIGQVQWLTYGFSSMKNSAPSTELTSMSLLWQRSKTCSDVFEEAWRGTHLESLWLNGFELYFARFRFHHFCLCWMDLSPMNLMKPHYKWVHGMPCWSHPIRVVYRHRENGWRAFVPHQMQTTNHVDPSKTPKKRPLSLFIFTGLESTQVVWLMNHKFKLCKEPYTYFGATENGSHVFVPGRSPTFAMITQLNFAFVMWCHPLLKPLWLRHAFLFISKREPIRKLHGCQNSFFTMDDNFPIFSGWSHLQYQISETCFFRKTGKSSLNRSSWKISLYSNRAFGSCCVISGWAPIWCFISNWVYSIFPTKGLWHWMSFLTDWESVHGWSFHLSILALRRSDKPKGWNYSPNVFGLCFPTNLCLGTVGMISWFDCGPIWRFEEEKFVIEYSST